MNKRSKAIAICNNAIRELTIELEKSDKSIYDMSQINQFKAHIQKMIRQLESGEIPPKNERRFGMGRVIVDTWPLNSALGALLCSAEQAYRDV